MTITRVQLVGNVSTGASFAGIVTASSFSGNITGGISSVARLQVTGVSTFTNGPVLIGSATSTGTASQRLQVTGSGYFSGSVGIGITNPVTPLHISDGNGGISTALYTSDYLAISAQNTAPGFNIIAAGSGTADRGVFKATRARGTLSSPTVPLTNDNTFSLLGAVYDGSTNRATAAINMDVDGTVGVGTAPQRITFWTGTGSSRLERARIDSSGNLGIGTINPSSTLSVGGTITELSFGQYWNVVTQADIGIGASQVPLNQYLGQLSFLDEYSPSGLRRSGGGADDVVVSADGSIGIGTTNPTSTLHVVGNSNFIGVVTATSLIPAETRFISIAEKLTRVNGNTVSLAYNASGANIGFATNPSGNITLAITGIPTTSDFDNHVLTFTVFVNQTGTARSCTAVTLNGVSRTIKWAGGSLANATSGVTTTLGYDIYGFTGINTIGSASTTSNYDVLGVVNGGYR